MGIHTFPFYEWKISGANSGCRRRRNTAPLRRMVMIISVECLKDTLMGRLNLYKVARQSVEMLDNSQIVSSADYK